MDHVSLIVPTNWVICKFKQSNNYILLNILFLKIAMMRQVQNHAKNVIQIAKLVPIKILSALHVGQVTSSTTRRNVKTLVIRVTSEIHQIIFAKNVSLLVQVNVKV